MHIRSLIAGAGLALTVVAVPVVVATAASADGTSSSDSSTGSGGCAAGQRWEFVGDVAAQLAAYPDVADLVTAVGQAPEGERAAAARTYLSEHPGVRTELDAVRTELRADRGDLRADRQTCRDDQSGD